MTDFPDKDKFQFAAHLWQYIGPSGWYFVSLPQKLSREIKDNFHWQEEGWGRMKATAQIGKSKWDTAIWYDRKQNTYLLPIKANIRKSEKLSLDQELMVTLWI